MKRTLALGAEGQLTEVEVAVPEGAALPWDANSVLSQVGQPALRIDGEAKVRGRAIYTADVRLPGMLHAAMVRSPHPAARIRSINTTHAAQMAGVAAVYLVAQPGSIVRFEGQELVAVAATSLHQARLAAAAVDIEYEKLEHATSLEVAMQPDAALVYPQAGDVPGKDPLPLAGNVRGPATGGRRFSARGDVEQALSDADARLEATYSTQVQTHSCLEPHGAVVAPTADGGLEAWVSTQSIASVVSDLARAFKLPATKVRVHCDFMGGGFGSKFGAGAYGVAAAHLARKTGKPVRLMLDRREEHLAGGNRPSSLQKVRLGATRAGKLQAVEVSSWGSAGTGTGAGVAPPFYVIYDAPHCRSFEHDVFTHTGPSAAFRAPGHPQGVFALESAIDELALQLQLDPVQFRLLNDPHPVRRLQWAQAIERFGWNPKRSQPPLKGAIRRGVGCAASVWYNIVETGVGATVLVHRDGSVELLSGVQDIGGGIRTVVAQVVAEVLGLEVAQVTVRIGDSQWPVGPGSGGSKTTASLTPAVHRAAEIAAQKLAALAPELGTPSEIRFEGGKLVGPAGSAPFLTVCGRMREASVSGFGERTDDMVGIAASVREDLRLLARTIAGVQMAEVEVDIETGIVRVVRVLAIQDCGRVMNPLAARSQMNGGIIQGISYALYEERVLDPFTGRMLNPNLESYRIAGVSEVPELDVVLMNVHTGLNSTGAMGLGEPATVPTAAAVANAVSHAIGGKRVRDLPLTPEKVLAAL